MASLPKMVILETQDCWIGGYLEQGISYWSQTGHVIYYTAAWAANQPDGGSGDLCIQMNYGESYKWDDITCEKKKAFICEIDQP